MFRCEKVLHLEAIAKEQGLTISQQPDLVGRKNHLIKNKSGSFIPKCYIYRKETNLSTTKQGAK